MTATVRGISLGREGSRSSKGAREYSVVYKVYTDDQRDGVGQVMSAVGIPSIGSILAAGNDIDSTAVVVNKRARQLSDSHFDWEVEIDYSTDFDKDPDENNESQNDNPLFELPDISYGFQQRRILVPGRFNDPLGPPEDKEWEQGIFAPNGELFDPQPEIDIYEPVWNIKRNIQYISSGLLMKLANCVNSDDFEGATARQLRFIPPRAQRKWHKACGYYLEAQFGIAYRWETWDLQLLNQGTYYFSGGKPTSVWSTTQARLTKQDASGNPLLVNLSTNGDINTSATPTFTRLRVLREMNFSSLNLLGTGPLSV